MKRYFVYILANRPRGVLYVGMTDDISRRLTQHRAKAVPGFTRTYGTTLLVYVEEHASLIEARAREHSLKRWRRAWKISLVENLNPNWRDLAEEIAG
jgi:putative endonuclease